MPGHVCFEEASGWEFGFKALDPKGSAESAKDIDEGFCVERAVGAPGCGSYI